LHSSQLGFEQTYNQIKKSIKVYNELRPHSSCDYLTPNQAHLQSENLKKRWKNYNKKFNYEKVVYSKFRIKNYICITILGFI
ncbi:MAG TPA: hypothetical protein VJU52_14910, partial [Flavobacterium sp.]|nr:hypothetical protein [Flavobacterium sp.]